MFGFALKAVDAAGGTQLAGGQNLVRVAGNFVVLLGDPVSSHGLPPHASPVMVEGSTLIRIDGVPICLEGHLASCGHATTGSNLVKASN